MQENFYKQMTGILQKYEIYYLHMNKCIYYKSDLHCEQAGQCELIMDI
jgi:hypothetical protein